MIPAPKNPEQLAAWRQAMSAAHIGKIPWCKGKKLSIKHVMLSSLARRGHDFHTLDAWRESHPHGYWYGKKRSKEFAEKVRLTKRLSAVRGLAHPDYIPLPRNEVYRLYIEENMSASQIARVFQVSKYTVLKRLREYGLKKDADKVESTRIRNGLSALAKRPNVPEGRVLKVIEQHSLPYRYVGNGAFLVGKKCPDFVDETRKRVVEVLGTAFHSPLLAHFKLRPSSTPEGLKAHYTSYGYSMTHIWDYETKNPALILKRLSVD